MRPSLPFRPLVRPSLPFRLRWRGRRPTVARYRAYYGRADVATSQAALRRTSPATSRYTCRYLAGCVSCGRHLLRVVRLPQSIELSATLACFMRRRSLLCKLRLTRSSILCKLPWARPSLPATLQAASAALGAVGARYFIGGVWCAPRLLLCKLRLARPSALRWLCCVPPVALGASAARYEWIDRRYLEGCVQRDRHLQQVVRLATSRVAFSPSVACYK